MKCRVLSAILETVNLNLELAVVTWLDLPHKRRPPAVLSPAPLPKREPSAS